MSFNYQTTHTVTGHTSGNNVDINFTFDYLDEDDVKVYKTDTSGTALVLGTNWQFQNKKRVRILNGTANVGTIADNDVFIIQRRTNVDAAYINYAPGSAVRAEDLNNNQLQALYSAQEREERSVNSTGGTVTGNVNIEAASIIFEGATANDFETTVTAADPTADRTITIPNTTGTLVTTGDTNTVTGTMIAADAINGDRIADDSINSEHYVDGSIDTAHIADSQVTTAKIADANVTTAKIADSNVTTAKIANSGVTTAKINDLAVTTAKIAADAVNGTKIADDSINSEHYVDGSIDTAHIADMQVTTAKIAADAVTGAKIADDTINSEHYAAGSIDTEHIADAQVTTAKIADTNVTTAKIADSNVTTAKIADANVTHAKLANDAVDGDNIADDSINSEHYVDGSIDTAHIADSQITSAKIANDTIVNADINSSAAIAGSKISMSLNQLSDVNVGTPGSGQDDQVLAWDNSAGEFSLTAASGGGGLGDIVDDSSPQLGGMLDVNGNSIGDGTLELLSFSETASAVNEFTITNAATGNGPRFSATGGDTNIDLDLLAKGTGTVTIRGNTNAGAITLNCENNSHGVTIRGPAHSAAATYTLTLPVNDGDANQFLQTDGSGVTSWQTVDTSASQSSNVVALSNPTTTDGFTVASNRNVAMVGPLTVNNGETITVSSGSTFKIL